jgi:hypothetical protein
MTLSLNDRSKTAYPETGPHAQLRREDRPINRHPVVEVSVSTASDVVIDYRVHYVGARTTRAPKVDG